MAGQYELNVRSNTYLTKNMRRIILQGSDLEHFPHNQESGHVKLVLPKEDPSQIKPLLRSYTVRAFDPAQQSLTLDFVDHGDTGPASCWANHCLPGDKITIRGPGVKKLVNLDADWFFLAADMSALPALSVNLETLPEDAVGYAFIEVLSSDDIQKLRHPENLQVHWIINPDLSCANQPLVERIMSTPWPKGTPYPWFAGEFTAMKSIRRFFRDTHQIDKRAMYISSYWKIGDTDEGMKRAKQEDAEA